MLNQSFIIVVLNNWYFSVSLVNYSLNCKISDAKLIIQENKKDGLWGNH